MALKSLGDDSKDAATFAQQVKDKCGKDVANYDCYAGSQVIVFAPYTVSAKMRQYNMPNIWENATGLMADWTGVASDKKVVMVLGDSGGAQENLIQVPSAGIADPPQWSLGLESLATGFVQRACAGNLGNLESPFTAGLAHFAAASLQYDLVTETRDAIGSAAAVALPQEEVIRTREGSLAALEEYVRTQKGASAITSEIACGMLFSLLDSHGFSKSKLVDREPFREFFAGLKKDGYEKGITRLIGSLGDCLGGNCADTLVKWNLTDGRVSQK